MAKKRRKTPWTRAEKKAYMAAYWIKNKTKIAENQRARRKANPEKAKLSSASWATAHPDLAKAASHAYYKNNRRALVKKTAKWRRDNPEKEKAMKKAYAKNNPDKIIAFHARYYANNRERLVVEAKTYRLANPEKIKASGAAWAKRNPDKTAAARQRRRALKYGNSTPEQIAGATLKIMALKKPKHALCSYCDARFTTRELIIEHIIALHRGGPHSPENITLACDACNSSKWKRLLYVEWFPKNYTKAKARAYLASLTPRS